MEKLTKKQGILYTQNVEELPIEERVFFSQGLVASKDDYREATPQEVQAYIEHKKAEEEKMKEMGGYDE